MKIKTFIQFINEELISGKEGKPFNLDDRTYNFFVRVFNKDTLAVKEFIQKSIGQKNLRFLGGGGIGLAFIGEDGKVIKFTTDESEKNGVDRMLKLAPGNERLPGFAKYYWIREVDLPESNWLKILKDQKRPEAERIEQRRQIEKILKTANLNDVRRYELEQRLKRLSNPDQEFIDRRKGQSKFTKAYIICLENLTLPNKIESEIAHNIFLFVKENYLIIGDDKGNKRKLSEFYDWTQSDNEVFQEEDFVKRGFQNKNIVSRTPGLTKTGFFGTSEDYKNMWKKEISKNFFMTFSMKMLNLYSRGKEFGIPTSDIHEGNIGYRGDELVAFDCM